MPSARPSVSDALLRLGVLACLGLAGLHVWLAWGMRDWPSDGPAPQPLPAVGIAEFMALFLLVPAAIVVATRWWQTRDRVLGLLGLAYGLAGVVVGSFGAATAGKALALNVAGALISLLGAGVAIRALRLR
ncbi:MAG: hypothetical protein WCO11_04585 [Sphingomonadales bacterium]|jgi:hypothetical protein